KSRWIVGWGCQGAAPCPSRGITARTHRRQHAIRCEDRPRRGRYPAGLSTGEACLNGRHLMAGPPVTRQRCVAVRTVGPVIPARTLDCAAPVGPVRLAAEHRNALIRALDVPVLHVELRAGLPCAGYFPLRARRRPWRWFGGFARRRAVRRLSRHRAASDEQRDQNTAQEKAQRVQNVILRRAAARSLMITIPQNRRCLEP